MLDEGSDIHGGGDLGGEELLCQTDRAELEAGGEASFTDDLGAPSTGIKHYGRGALTEASEITQGSLVAEAGLIDTGLEALHVLAEMDEQLAATGERHWRPSHWTPDPAT